MSMKYAMLALGLLTGAIPVMVFAGFAWIVWFHAPVWYIVGTGAAFYVAAIVLTIRAFKGK